MRHKFLLLFWFRKCQLIQYTTNHQCGDFKTYFNCLLISTLILFIKYKTSFFWGAKVCKKYDAPNDYIINIYNDFNWCRFHMMNSICCKYHLCDIEVMLLVYRSAKWFLFSYYFISIVWNLKYFNIGAVCRDIRICFSGIITYG